MVPQAKAGPQAVHAGQQSVDETTVLPVEINKLAKRTELVFAIGIMIFVGVVFALGRVYWDERYYVPDEGLGYYLGLTGGVLMLLAYGYSLFKYVPALRTKWVMKHWLTAHLLFGLVGPFLIMFHSTFHIGSLNGGIALFSVFLVFVSGVMGRFLYSKTHYGLGGKKAKVNDLKDLLRFSGRKIKSKRLDNFTHSVMVHPDSFWGALWDLMSFGWRSRWLYFQLTGDMRHHIKVMVAQQGCSRAQARQQIKTFKLQLRDYILTLRKVALFSVYERFFAFWRNSHTPMVYLLLMSGIVHVIAVHMY